MDDVERQQYQHYLYLASRARRYGDWQYAIRMEWAAWTLLEDPYGLWS